MCFSIGRSFFALYSSSAVGHFACLLNFHILLAILYAVQTKLLESMPITAHLILSSSAELQFSKISNSQLLVNVILLYQDHQLESSSSSAVNMPYIFYVVRIINHSLTNTFLPTMTQIPDGTKLDKNVCVLSYISLYTTSTTVKTVLFSKKSLTSSKSSPNTFSAMSCAASLSVHPAVTATMQLLELLLLTKSCLIFIVFYFYSSYVEKRQSSSMIINFNYLQSSEYIGQLLEHLVQFLNALSILSVIQTSFILTSVFNKSIAEFSYTCSTKLHGVIFPSTEQ